MEKSKTSWFSKSNNVLLFIFGCLFFIGLGHFSILFYQERMLNIDSAGFAFHLAQTGDFCLPLGRWGSLFSQVTPLLALKLGVSLDTFLKIYSVNFILLQFFGFILITVVLKETKAGIIYLLAACLTIRYTFYFSASEFAQGLNLCVILYALMNGCLKSKNQKKRLYLLIASLALIAVMYYFHQLLVVPILFVLVFLGIKNKGFRSKFLLITLLFSVFWFGAQLLMLPSSGYEAGKIPNLQQIKSGLSQFSALNSNKYYWLQIKNVFLVAFLLGIAALVILYIKRKWLMASFILISSASYYLLIALTYALGESPNMYEQYFIVFGLIIAISMVYALALILKRKYVLFISILVLIYSLQGIYHTHEIPTKRLTFLKHMIDLSREHNSMIALHPDNVQWGYVWTGWAVPVETLLLSSIDGGPSTSIYVTDGQEQINKYPEKGQLYSASWQADLMTTSTLNKRFFMINKPIKYHYIPRLEPDYYFYYDLIKYDYVWMEGVKSQAKNEGATIEETISANAAYMALNHQSSQNLTSIERKILEIKSSFEWMENIKIKAKKLNKPIDQVIREDAQYIVATENKH